jgi:FMN-dependent NADH-azoreductase
MRELLYVDSCVNRATSRTERLAQELLGRLEAPDVHRETLVLEEEHLTPLDGELASLRIACLAAGDFSHPVYDYAKQFAAADEVVIAAPYWDFSVPAMLKCYLERLCSQGITFLYSAEGVPTGLCRARRVWYMTTAGGYIGEFDYGLDQVRAICQGYFGIPEVRGFRAEGLDIVTNDVEAIMAAALKEIRSAEL